MHSVLPIYQLFTIRLHVELKSLKRRSTSNSTSLYDEECKGNKIKYTKKKKTEN